MEAFKTLVTTGAIIFANSAVISWLTIKNHDIFPSLLVIAIVLTVAAIIINVAEWVWNKL